MKTTLVSLLTATALLATAPAALADTARVTTQGSVTGGSFNVAQNRTYLDVLAELEAEGYSIEEVKKTWLGRIKIMAESRAHLREIVVSSSTGEIMSDVIVEVFAKGGEATDSAGTARSSAAAAPSAGASTSISGTVSGAVSGTVSGAVSGNAGGGVSVGLGN